MKNSIINIRVDESTRDQLETLSISKGENVSSIIREAVNQYLETNIYLDPEIAKIKSGIHIIQTIGFSEFIFWIYHKYIDPEIMETKDLYIKFIELIRECEKYPLFGPEIMIEFDKVAKELNQVVYDPEHNLRDFQFFYGTDNPFNYEVLCLFMYMLRYDADNNQVIFIK